MRKILLTFLILLTTLGVQGQIVNIPDANFKFRLLNHFTLIDLNGDGQIQVSEAAAVTGTLNVCCSNISDLTGIDAFVNAKVISCFGNKLTSLSLNNFPALEFLNAGDNKLTSFSINNAPALNELWVFQNKLTSLSLSNLPSLLRLSCYINLLTSLNLVNLPLLVQIECYYNNFGNLSLSNLPSLISLWCDYSQLTSLSLSNLPSLKSLRCEHNLLDNLDLSQVPVILLSCAYNPDLEYINIKNGAISTNNGSFFFSPLPSLHSICADETERILVTNTIHTQLPGQNVAVSSFCNFNPEGGYNTIKGTVRLDINTNGCNNLDSGMNDLKINITDGVQTGATFTNKQGNYKFFVGLNNYTVSPFFIPPWFISTPTSQTASFSSYGNTQVVDFCATAVGIHPDLEIILIPVRGARPGFDANYKLVYRNKGNQINSGTVFLVFDNSKMNLISSSPPEIQQPPGTLSWPFVDLNPYETRTINLQFHVNAPPVVNQGDTLSFISTIYHIAGDETPEDNKHILKQVVVNSIDPNDKHITESSQIGIDKLGEYLHYVVNFQNTGTANAISVIVKDSLSANLDWNSFEPIIASHPYRAVITKGYLAEFIFDGINLPPKSINEPASNGFVSFKIKPKSNLVIGDSIQNTASIYFDFNLPIVTNTVTTKIYKPGNNNTSGVTVYSNPTKDYLSFSIKPGVEIKGINLFNSMGQKMNFKITESTATNRKIDVSNFANGMYFLELITDLGRLSQKVMIAK